MKKLLIILLVFALFVPVNVVFANSFNVIVDTKSANTGDTVEINVNFENNIGIIAALFNVEYDKDRLELTDVQDGNILEGATYSPNYKTYPYKMVWNSASYNNFTGNGVLVTLKFKVKEDAEPGKAYINLTYKENDIFDVDLNNVAITVINGGIDVADNNKSDNTGNNSSKPSSGTSTKPSSGGITVVNPTPDSNMKFTDVKIGDWYYEAVKFAFEKGITSGVSDTSYAPDDNVTRGQFITMLLRAYNIPEAVGDNFSDCGNTWYTGYLAAAKQLGISNGVGDNKFAPEKEITREEMVTLIYNYLKFKGEADEDYVSTTFADDYLISDWAKSAVNFASSKGYVKGKENNMFDPKGKAARAELAQVFFNIFSK